MTATKLFALLVPAFAACGDNAATLDAASGPDASNVAPQVWSGTAIDGHNTVLPNVSVCLPDYPAVACATTDDGGNWTLNVPTPSAAANVAMVVTADGYYGQLYQDAIAIVADVGITSEYVSNPAVILDAEEKAFLGTQAGFTYPDTTHGFIQVRVLADETDRAGYTATISPVSGHGPVFLDDNAVPKPALTSTSTSGGLLFGNVAPGHYDITISQPGHTCFVDGAGGHNLAGDWVPYSNGSIGVDVVGGAVTTNLNVACS